jgi:hypothetical protein
LTRSLIGDQHGGVVERITDRHRRQPAVMRGEGFDAAQNSGVQRAHAHGRLQTRDQPLDRQRGIGRKRDRDGGFLVAVDARDDRHDRAVRGGDLQAEHARGGFIGRGARLGDNHGGGLDRNKGGRRIGPCSLDNREGAGGNQCIDQVGRRAVGDHDHWTLQRHGGTRLQNEARA